MNEDIILARFGELTIKGRNRSRFEDKMVNQIKSALSAFPALTYRKTYGRLYIQLNGTAYEPVAERLKDIFGLVSFSRVVRCSHDPQQICRHALEMVRAVEPAPRTFKVAVKRAWKQFPHDSMEMNHIVGAYVLRHSPNLQVDVRQPELELKIDIQSDGVYMYATAEQGAGGFPLGTNGRALLLLSGGIDSPVAGWMAMRKGLEVEAVHFHSYPFTSELAKEKVVSLAQRLAYYSGSIKLHLVPFTDVQTLLAQSGQPHLTITLMRRAMLQIAQRLAETRRALAIVTGDSLGQVASQTLSSMNVIGRETRLPLLRPLIAMDKREIIQMAEKIGTYETSILPYEDCCTLFIPKSPATNPNLRVVERLERQLDPQREQLIQAAVANVELLELTENTRSDKQDAEADEDRWF